MKCGGCERENAGYYHSTCIFCGYKNVKEGEFLIHEYWVEDVMTPYVYNVNTDVLTQKIYMRIRTTKTWAEFVQTTRARKHNGIQHIKTYKE